MYIYFKVGIDDSVLEVIRKPYELEAYNTKELSEVNGKPYIVPVTETVPTFNTDTQVRGEAVNNVVNGTITYPVRDKTQQELDADAREADISAIRGAIKDIGIILVQLSQKLLQDGVVTTNDFTPNIRQTYQDLKQRVDRIAD